MSADLTARGKAETQILRENINDQLNRLLTQLEDLEELKEEFSPSEYGDIRSETLNQLGDFQAFLASSIKGDLTLVNEFGAASLAIQAAVSQAFKTPEVIRLFAARQPDQLRHRLIQLHNDHKMHKITTQELQRQSLEILLALKKINSEDFTEEESNMLNQYSSSSGTQLEDLDTAAAIVDHSQQVTIISQAKQQINQAHK